VAHSAAWSEQSGLGKRGTTYLNSSTASKTRHNPSIINVHVIKNIILSDSSHEDSKAPERDPQLQD